MLKFTPPLRDIEFALTAGANVESLLSYEAFREFDLDLFRAVIEEAGKVVAGKITHSNRKGDEVGCSLENGVVRTPPGFKEAYEEWTQGGWVGLALNPDHGGQGLPHTIGVAVSEMLCAGNTAFSLYPGLTRGVAHALDVCADSDLKARYLPRLVSGEWCGTMCLSEPQAGSDVGANKTRAVRNPDGSYRLDGMKIWITGGEHDLTEQIVHLVLARVPDAPEGTRGLSLFLVPKFLVNGDGTLGNRNGVSCSTIEHKMGINGSATCALTFDGATGYLVGEVNRGMTNMFTIMNYERFEIGLQGLGISEISTQNAIHYAKERVQFGPIVQHPDVRRMLFTMKAYTEGMRFLSYMVAADMDRAAHESDQAARGGAQDRVDLMIPVVKALFTDLAVEISSLGVQIYGGVGYVREYGMEQNIRDARIGPIYEGTNGIQALDLVGRKLTLHDGRLWKSYLDEIDGFLNEAGADDAAAPILAALGKVMPGFRKATSWMVEKSRSPAAAAGATDYLRGFGLVSLGYAWARAAVAAAAKPAGDPFWAAKLATARFYAERLLVGPASAAFEAGMAGEGDFLALPAAAL